MLKITFFLSAFLFLGWSASGQVVQEPKSYLALYQDQLLFFQELISGGLYADAPKNFDGFPFYNTRVFESGVLKINEVSYSEVPLLYDSQADWVITFHPIYNQKILIKSEKVDEFKLSDGSVFRNFKGNDSYNHHENGFYEVAFDREIKLLIKHYKVLKPVKELGQFTKEYIAYSDFFFWNKEQFESVSRKSQAIKLLGLDKKEVKQSFKGNSLDFKRNMEEYLARLVQLRVDSDQGFEGFVK
jgi:hypothetical protein